MSEIFANLLNLVVRLDKIVKEASSGAISKQIQNIHDAVDQIASSWSGSPLGYHACVYYQGFKPPPPGASFSIEWGLYEPMQGGSVGTWTEYPYDGVRDHVLKKAGVSSLEKLNQFRNRAREIFDQGKEELLSYITVALETKPDDFLLRLKTQVENASVLNSNECAQGLLGQRQLMTRDPRVNQGIQLPPHLSILAPVLSTQSAIGGCVELGRIARRASSHIQSRERNPTIQRGSGNKVFIGHGRAQDWKDLKDFIKDRLELPWDEFNRVPVAGVTNIQRLSQMLDEAAIAFLVMTAEDEQVDGKMRARMNVLHEAGLFQGRLGFSKAIVVMEEGCEEFSNINGLGQIRFPKGNIKAAFEEVRRVLEREAVLEA